MARIEAPKATSLFHGIFFNTGASPVDVSKVSETIVQVAHGFSTGDAIFKTGAGPWTLARANDADTVKDAFVEIIDADSFRAVYFGILPWAVHGLTLNTLYYLSPSVAGAVVSTKPVGVGEFIDPVLRVMDANSVRVLDQLVVAV